ncbi:MAG: RNA polymerase sigma factor [Planctomycetes bacterium]|nr:RNA polymerase sigma factor [Planctomycetota bacterium]
MDTPDLVAQASRGDRAALDALFARHLPGVLAFVRASAGAALLARDDSLDLVQSACRELLRDAPPEGWRDEAGFRRWLYLAAERKVLDRARYHGREKRADAARRLTLSEAEVGALSRGWADLATPSRRAIGREEIERLEAALARASEADRRVILLARVAGLSHAEVAAELATTEANARSALRRALARLALELGREPGPDAD